MSLKTDPPTLNLRGIFYYFIHIYLTFFLLLTLNYHNLKINEETISKNKFHYSSDELIFITILMIFDNSEYYKTFLSY